MVPIDDDARDLESQIPWTQVDTSFTFTATSIDSTLASPSEWHFDTALMKPSTTCWLYLQERLGLYGVGPRLRRFAEQRNPHPL